jgi:LPXTG-motif cell wall-anchored protein
MGLFTKMRATMDRVKKEMKAKAKIAIAKMEKEKVEKGLTTEEYIEAKNNGTLAILPVVNNTSSNETTNYYIIGGIALGLVAAYVIYKKKNK